MGRNMVKEHHASISCRTEWSRVASTSRTVKNLPQFLNPCVRYRVHKPRQLSLSWARLTRSTAKKDLLKLHFKIPHLWLGLPSALSFSGFPTTAVCTSLLSPYVPRPYSYLIIPILFTRMISGEQYRSWSSSLCSLHHSPVILLILFPNTFLSRLFFNTATLFFLQRERPSFTPIHNNRQNYIAAYFNLCVFERRIGRQKILDRMVAGIPCLP